MRCADFGPTPGKQRNAWIKRSSDEGDAATPSLERQLHAGRQLQTSGETGHFFLAGGLRLADSIIDRRRNQILQQAGIAMLSQANALPNQVLQLLQR